MKIVGKLPYASHIPMKCKIKMPNIFQQQQQRQRSPLQIVDHQQIKPTGSVISSTKWLCRARLDVHITAILTSLMADFFIDLRFPLLFCNFCPRFPFEFCDSSSEITAVQSEWTWEDALPFKVAVTCYILKSISQPALKSDAILYELNGDIWSAFIAGKFELKWTQHVQNNKKQDQCGAWTRLQTSQSHKVAVKCLPFYYSYHSQLWWAEIFVEHQK